MIARFVGCPRRRARATARKRWGGRTFGIVGLGSAIARAQSMLTLRRSLARRARPSHGPQSSASPCADVLEGSMRASTAHADRLAIGASPRERLRCARACRQAARVRPRTPPLALPFLPRATQHAARASHTCVLLVSRAPASLTMRVVLRAWMVPETVALRVWHARERAPARSTSIPRFPQPPKPHLQGLHAPNLTK